MANQPEINLANIEVELNRLWESQKEKKFIKASLFNLIIYANNEIRTEFLDDLVKAILEKYPCRIIFILATTDSSKNYLRTSVSNTIIGKGENAIVCDRINIEVSHSQLYRVPFVIMPILIPDLPIYLLWDEDPTADHKILPHFKPYVSRIIFNSDCTHNLHKFSRKMLDEIQREHLELRDINWAAGGVWRALLGHVFNTEEKIHSLRNCRNIRIEFNKKCRAGSSHPEIQAIYFQAWIAAQLGWSYKAYEKQEENRFFNYVHGDAKIVVELVPNLFPTEISGGIHSLEINTAGENILVISESGATPKATIHISSKDRCEIPYHLPLPNLKKGAYIIRELFYRKTSDHYRKMLMLLAEWEES